MPDGKEMICECVYLYDVCVVHHYIIFPPYNLTKKDSTKNFLPMFKVDIWLSNRKFLVKGGV